MPIILIIYIFRMCNGSMLCWLNKPADSEYSIQMCAYNVYVSENSDTTLSYLNWISLSRLYRIYLYSRVYSMIYVWSIPIYCIIDAHIRQFSLIDHIQLCNSKIMFAARKRKKKKTLESSWKIYGELNTLDNFYYIVF